MFFEVQNGAGAQTFAVTGLGDLTANILTSAVAIGTSPLTVTSTTKVSNLNVDLLDDQSGAFYLDSVNFTGTDWTTLTDGSNADALHVHAGGTDLTGLGVDNRIPRWDGTDTLQSSGVTLNDSDHISNLVRLGIGSGTPLVQLHFFDSNPVIRMPSGSLMNWSSSVSPNINYFALHDPYDVPINVTVSSINILSGGGFGYKMVSNRTKLVLYGASSSADPDSFTLTDHWLHDAAYINEVGRTGTITRMFGYRSSIPPQIGLTGTDWADFVADEQPSVSSSATLTNRYGLWLRDSKSGATNYFGIRIEDQTGPVNAIGIDIRLTGGNRIGINMNGNFIEGANMTAPSAPAAGRGRTFF